MIYQYVQPPLPNKIDDVSNHLNGDGTYDVLLVTCELLEVEPVIQLLLEVFTRK